jgi:hypothetical protein
MAKKETKKKVAEPASHLRTNGSVVKEGVLELGTRLAVNKAYKMFVGGAFVRSESGRYFQVRGAEGEGADPVSVNIPRG